MGVSCDARKKQRLEQEFLVKKQSHTDKVVALAGNPNVGKSTVFNGLTGLNQHTGNWPGKTVANAQGYFKTEKFSYVMVDLPGTYSLQCHSKEEEAARDFLCSGEPDAVIVVCDATCLERNLNLALQIMVLGCPVLICLNLLDEAEKKGIIIDEAKLSGLLGVPVTGIVARKKKSLKKLAAVLDTWMEMQEDKAGGKIQYKAGQMREVEKALKGEKQFIGAKKYDSRRSRENEVPDSEEELASRMMRVSERACQQSVIFSNKEYLNQDRRLDAVFMNKWTAYPVMLLLLAAILWITIAGANVPSVYLSQFFFWLEENIFVFLGMLQVPEWFREAVVHGIFRELFWVVSVMLPPMAIFFPLFTLLEDSGYLPRIAYNLDRPFQCCHACGKQALTMCMVSVYLYIISNTPLQYLH